MESTNEKLPEVAKATPKKALAKKKAVTVKKKAAPATPKVKATKKAAVAKPETVEKKSKKEILREQIAATLETTFAGLKDALGEKKFHSHVKKASKVLAAGAVKKSKAAAKEKKD